MPIKVVVSCCLLSFAAADLTLLRGLSTRWNRALQSSTYGNKSGKLSSAMGGIPRGGATFKAAKRDTTTPSKKTTKSSMGGMPRDEYAGMIAMGGSGMKTSMSAAPFLSTSAAPLQPPTPVPVLPSTFAPQSLPPTSIVIATNKPSMVHIPTNVPVPPTKTPVSKLPCYNSCSSPLVISVGTTFTADTSCSRPTATFYNWFLGIRSDLPGSWFTFLAPKDCGTATVSVTETGDSDFDPLLFVYDGANGTCVSATEESAFLLAASDPTAITWSTTDGATYTILMAFNGTGPFSTYNVDVTCAPPSSRPCPDSCSSPIAISEGTEIAFDSSCIRHWSITSYCSDNEMSSLPGSWFTFEAPKGCGTAKLFTKRDGNPHFQYDLRFYNGTEGACISAANASACIDTIYENKIAGGSGWATTDGATYVIFMPMFPSYSAYEVNVNCTPPSNLPCPSSCSSPLAISTGITEVDSSCLANKLSPYVDCAFGSDIHTSVTWFTFQAPVGCGSATVAIVPTGTSAFWSHVNVYEGTPESACDAALNASACIYEGAYSSAWAWSPIVGKTYVIVATGATGPHPSGKGCNGEANGFEFSTFNVELTCQ